MRAGRLRHQIIFQNQTTDPDAAGQPADTWSNVATVWGAIDDISGRELVRGGVVSGQVTTRITIRHRSDISNGMRAVTPKRSFEIVSPPIDVDGRGRQLEIMCRELNP